MLKVHILDCCPYRNDKAYLPVGDATNAKAISFTSCASRKTWIPVNFASSNSKPSGYSSQGRQ
jgi:hypothetical protein